MTKEFNPNGDFSRILGELNQAIESLLITGLTSASADIQNRFRIAFEYATKHRLVRLSANLRFVNEELQRFFQEDKRFSERRLSMFLNRSWLLSRRYLSDLQTGNKQNDSLPQTRLVENLRLIAIGIQKKSVFGVFSALEFRLQDIDQHHEKPLIWSCVMAAPPETQLAPETLLYFEQPQKFRPESFLNTVICVDQANLVEDEFSIRISFPKHATVRTDEALYKTNINDVFKNKWPLDAIIQRLSNLQNSPLHLETQPQEEILLKDGQLGPEHSHIAFSEKTLFPISVGNQTLYLLIGNDQDGEEQLKFFRNAKDALKGSTLYGLLHFEQGLALLQPLSLWKKRGSLKHLMLGKAEKTDYKKLLKSMK